MPHLSALLFVLSCEIIAWSVDIEPKTSPFNFCGVTSQIKEISCLLPSLKLYGQNQLSFSLNKFFGENFGGYLLFSSLGKVNLI